MREKGRDRDQISKLANCQHGHVTRQQLLAIGLGPRAIKHRLGAGDLIAVHAGVYAVGHVPRHAIQRAAAAVLACGDEAALSFAASLALWDLGEWPLTMEVTAPREHRRPGIRCHCSRSLSGRDLRRRHGIRTTSPPRTIADMAPPLTDAQLIRLINDARLAKLLGPAAMRDLLARCSRAKRLLGDRPEEQRPTRSELEDRFRRFVVRHKLPMPEINAVLNGREVDALYRAEKLIIEVDGWTTHSDRRSFERDRLKDADALAEDHATLRITDQRLTHGGAEQAERIRTILAARGLPPS